MDFTSNKYFEDEQIDINITPLIDIVFLLLIFFMVSTTFVEKSKIGINLPKASNTVKNSPVTETTISISKEGEYFYKQKKISIAKIEDIFEKDGNLSLVIRADKSTKHEKVVELMNLANKKGLKTISIAVRDES